MRLCVAPQRIAEGVDCESGLGDCEARGGAGFRDRLSVFVDVPVDLDFEFTLNSAALTGVGDFHCRAERAGKIHGESVVAGA